jgi:hypothetical protein
MECIVQGLLQFADKNKLDNFGKCVLINRPFNLSFEDILSQKINLHKLKTQVKSRLFFTRCLTNTLLAESLSILLKRAAVTERQAGLLADLSQRQYRWACSFNMQVVARVALWKHSLFGGFQEAPSLLKIEKASQWNLLQAAHPSLEGPLSSMLATLIQLN